VGLRLGAVGWRATAIRYQDNETFVLTLTPSLSTLACSKSYTQRRNAGAPNIGIVIMVADHPGHRVASGLQQNRQAGSVWPCPPAAIFGLVCFFVCTRGRAQLPAYFLYPPAIHSETSRPYSPAASSHAK
jgi:hypothetical protein